MNENNKTIIGYEVKEHSTNDSSKDFNKENIIENIEFEELGHINMVGTCGSGRTTLGTNVIKQSIENGNGGIIIDYKGNTNQLKNFEEFVMLKNRGNDFFVLNLLDKRNSNTLNILESGSYEELKDTVTDLIFTNKDKDTWENMTIELFQSILKVVLFLRDSNLVWNPKYTKEINTIEDIEKYKDIASIFTISEIMSNPSTIFEFAIAISRLYKNGVIPQNKNYKKEIHYKLKMLLSIIQGYDIPEWDKVVELGSYENLMDTMDDKEKSIYKINVSCSIYGKMSSLFLESFGEIFGVKEGDTNLEDILINDKILYVVLQGVSPYFSNLISSLLIKSINTAIRKRRWTSDVKLNPLPIFFDEFILSGNEDISDFLSISRSRDIQVIISSFKNIPMLNSNTMTTIVLRNYEDDFKEYNLDRDITKTLLSGQGYIIQNDNEVKKFLISKDGFQYHFPVTIDEIKE